MLFARTHRVRTIASIAVTVATLFISSVAAEGADLGPTNQYIITVDDSNRVETIAALRAAGASIDDTYENALEGFLVEIPDALAVTLRSIPHVLGVELNQPIALFADQQFQSPTPSWGLDRIDQREPVSTASGYVGSYGYKSAGAGATIYVVDTGIYPNDDIAGRISGVGFAGFNDGYGTVDCYGHGTHVSTTAAGKKYGVAKNALLVPVRVLNCSGSGSYATVIAGLDWILSDQNTNSRTAAVVNMSLGGLASVAINNAIAKLTNAGIVVAVAAGNNGADACNYSPASAPSAITVGATNALDTMASFSNRGPCVDISAPGTSITGGWIGSPSATATIQGTSMATPHVAGAAAVYRALNPSASVAQVTEALLGQATENAIQNIPAGTVNKLLYISPSDGGPLVVAPTIQVKSISNVTSSSATALVEINPGNAATTATLEISADAAFATGVKSINLTPSAVTGDTVIPVTSDLTALTPSTTFYARAKATNSSGTSTSAVLSFVTEKFIATPPVVVATQPTMVTGYSARITGTVNASGTATDVSFQYGTDPTFASNTVTNLANPQSVGGTTTTNVSLDISYLNASTTYYYRIIAGNSAASVNSNSISFTTPAISGVAPSVVTIRPTNGLNTPTTTITGQVNPMGQTTTVRLVYGYEASLTVSPIIVTLPTQYTGIDTVTVTADMTKLVPGSRYYYRFEASNAAGITKPTALTNVGNPVMPVISNTYVTSQTQNSLELRANVNAGGGNIRVYFIYGSTANLSGETFTVAATPFAITNGLNNVVAFPMNGLTAGQSIYFRVKIFAYTGPLAEQGGTMYGPIVLAQTLNAPTPAKTAQTITFNLPTSRYFGGAPTVLNATATSGLPVSYQVTTPTICAVSTVDSVTSLSYLSGALATTSATCTVSASQNGNATYSAATAVVRSMVWSKENTQISPRVISNGETLTVAFALTSTSQPGLAENIDAGRAMTVSSRTPNVCREDKSVYVGENGVHTQTDFKKIWNGVCVIYVEFAGASYWLASNLTTNTTIAGMTTPAPGASAPQTINFKTIANTTYGNTAALVATASSGLPVSFATRTPAICTVEQLVNGSYVAREVAGLTGDANTCQIAASQAGDSRFAAAVTQYQSFRWLRTAQTISFTPLNLRYYGGAPTVLTATASSGLPVTFSTTTPAVCAISQQDSVTVLSYVTPIPAAQLNICTVTASQAGSGTIAAAMPVGRSIVWSKELTNIQVAWPTALSVDGSAVDFRVTSASQPSLNENLGGTSALSITTNTPKVCQVASTSFVGANGVHTRAIVKSIWNGACSITVIFAGNSYWLTSTTTSAKVVSGMTTPQPGASAAQSINFGAIANRALNTSAPLSASATSGLPVTFISTTPSVCSVISAGNNLFAAQPVAGLAGDNNTCTITASQNGDDRWAAATPVARSFKFTRLAQSLVFSLPTSRYYGGAGTNLTATSTSGLAVTYSTTTPTICQIATSGGGFVLNYSSPIATASSAMCTVIASQTGNDQYLPAPSVSRNIVWMKEPTQIRATWAGMITTSGTNLDLTVVSAAQPSLNESLAGSSPLTVVSKTPNVCSVTAAEYVGTTNVHTRATVKSLWNGTCQLQVTFAGNSYWLASSILNSVSITGMTTPEPGANAYQTVAISASSAIEIGGTGTVVTVASSKLPVTVTTTTPNICAVTPGANGAYSVTAAPGVSGDGLICTLIASQAGDTRWAPATSVSRSITFNRPLTYINASVLNNTNLGATPYVVTGNLLLSNSSLNGGSTGLALPLSLTSNTPAVCTVGGVSQVAISGGTQSQATVTAVTNGICTLAWNFAGDGTRKPAVRTFSLNQVGKK